MKLVIVPNVLRDKLYEIIDVQIALHPDALPDREYFYKELLNYFDEHGSIPQFELYKKEAKQ